METERKMTADRVREAMRTLMKYRDGKANGDRRVRETENWWKLRSAGRDRDEYTSGWLFNSVINRHADAIQMYPMPIILPREPEDRETAEQLASIVPCILEQNGFEETYSRVMWQKMKQGTGIYGVFWDPDLLGGLGDISVRKIDVLRLFWEPGISDIQDSKNVFLVTPMDRDELVKQYPQLKEVDLGKCFNVSEYPYDDRVDRSESVPVVDWYYRTGELTAGGGIRKKLHYCRFVNDTVLYASEDDVLARPGRDESPAEAGWYDHGEYPFIMDPLFPMEGTPCGFGYVDAGRSAQEQIDRLNSAIVKNALVAATPRYFVREDGGINESEFADLSRPFVHVNSNLGDDTIRRIQTDALHSNYLAILNNKITELKETGNNIDSSNGITNGVTAASGIAAQQEAAGKTSRAATMSAYRAFGRVVRQILELIAQFYDVGRVFRITGKYGAADFLRFDNSGMRMRDTDDPMTGYPERRKPVFDIRVSAQSHTVYTRNSRNELVTALANMGVFDPSNTDQALLLLDAMDFDGKEEIARKVAEAGTTQQMFAGIAQIALQLAQMYEPETAEEIASILNARGAALPVRGSVPGQKSAAEAALRMIPGEDKRVSNARKRSREAGAVRPQ